MSALLFALLGCAQAWAADAQGSVAQVTATLSLAVAQPEQVADALVARAEEAGGWFRSLAPGSVSLAIPQPSFEPLLRFAEEQGVVLERSIDRRDASVELAELRGKLQARQSMLASYRAVLTTASPEGILTVEREVTSVISQIETLQGQIQLLEDQVAHARLDVSFQFRSRAAPRRDGSSSFAWLNTLNVQDVLATSSAATPAHRTRKVTVPAPPGGFASWSDERAYRAISAEGVLFQVRTVEQRPAADLAFWQEAVRERMAAAGYKILAERSLEASGREGGLIELGAPLGSADLLYWVAFFPVGNRIVVAEAAGEILDVEGHREALLAALQELKL